MSAFPGVTEGVAFHGLDHVVLQGTAHTEGSSLLCSWRRLTASCAAGEANIGRAEATQGKKKALVESEEGVPTLEKVRVEGGERGEAPTEGEETGGRQSEGMKAGELPMCKGR